jgi:nucleotide-binding universal stress UspA family protein
MYRKILVGYDGSEAGKKAFETGLELAATHGAELYVLTVSRPPEIGDDVETEAVIENSRRYHRDLLAALEPAVTAKGVWRTSSGGGPSRRTNHLRRRPTRCDLSSW